MAIQRASIATAIYLLCLARNYDGTRIVSHGFAPPSSSSTTTKTTGASIIAAPPPSSTVVLKSQTDPTPASEKAALLRARAEEAKRKAEELKKVAEMKAEAVMVAMKNAGSSSSSGSEATVASSSSSSSPRMPVVPPLPPRVETSASSSSPSSSSSSSSSYSSPGGAIIPINRENVEFASGVLAGGVALALGASPVFAIVAAATVNYVSRKDDLGELHELVQGLSRASLGTINWIAKLDAKYAILGKLSETLDKSLGELRTNPDVAGAEGENADAFRTIEETVTKTTRQIQKLAEEIDLLEGGKQALGAMGEVLETSIDKAVDANREYKLTERAAEAARKAMERAKEMNK
jgi:hypothetical protein